MDRISERERKHILELFYQKKSRKEIGAEVGHSPATVQRVIKEHEGKVKENGLIYELSEEQLTEPLELARLYGELQTANVSVTDCRDAIPIVQKCRSLKIEEERANELIDAAITVGEPDFPREQFVGSLLNILRRERTTGQTIEQIEVAYNQQSNEVQRQQAVSRTLTSQISQFEQTKTRQGEQIRSAQAILSALQSRLSAVPVTETQLAIYIADRNFLATNGLDMNDPARSCLLIKQFRTLNYNSTAILDELLRIGNLEATIRTLTTKLTELQVSLLTLAKQKDELTKEIESLKNQLQELQKQVRKETLETQAKIADLNEQVQKETQVTQAKIANLKQKFLEELAAQGASERDLADFLASREALREGGITL